MKEENKKSAQYEVSDILTAVCEVYDVTRREVKSDIRVRRVSDARHMVAYLCITECGMKQHETAKLLKRTIPTIHYSYESVENLIKYNKHVRERYMLVLAALNNKSSKRKHE